MIKWEDKTMTKKFYNQPEVQVAQIETSSIICASGASGTGAGKLNLTPTDDQW